MAEALYAAKEVTREVSGFDRAPIHAEVQEGPVMPGGPELSNQATNVLGDLIAALRSDDVEAAAGLYAQSLTFEDLRAVSEDPITDRAGIRVALTHLREQYSHIDEDALRGTG